VQAFRPKDIYPCTVDRYTYTSDISMEMLFGDICSANIFQADKELHAELGIKDPEAEESQRSTPSPSRDRSKSPVPRPVQSIATHAQTEQASRQETGKATVSRSSSAARLETPHKRAKRSRSGQSRTPSSTKSEKSARMETMYNAALSQKWEKGFFTSVDGYHNQEPEKEL
jgi:DNA cross-link repair 1C protein